MLSGVSSQMSVFPLQFPPVRVPEGGMEQAFILPSPANILVSAYHPCKMIQVGYVAVVSNSILNFWDAPIIQDTRNPPTLLQEG